MMSSNAQGSAKQPIVAVKIFGTTLTGAAAAAVLLTFLAAIVAMIVYLWPRVSWSPLWLSAALWVLFIVYWSVAAGNASPVKSSESPRSRQLHQLLMYGAIVLAFLRLPGLNRRWLPAAPAVVVAGLALHAVSVLLAVWARRHLGRNWSGAITAKEQHQLVRTGPYRWLRHPIYTAMLGMLAGTAVVSGEMHALIAMAILIIAYWRKIRLEERQLLKIFGTEYETYRRESWAVIPGLL